jgi:hypothetical protein
MQNLPRQIIASICQYAPPVSTANLLRALNLRPLKSEEQKIACWSAIFRSDKWLIKIINEISTANPLLIGPELDKFSFDNHKRSERFYVLLHSGDRYGEVMFHMESFFESLHEHNYDESRHEVIFQWGVLNICEPLYQLDTIRLDNDRLKRLFSLEGQLQSQYSFYKSKEIRNLLPPHILHRDVPIDGLDGCAANLFQGDKLLQFFFITPDSELHPIAWDSPGSDIITTFCPESHDFRFCPRRR